MLRREFEATQTLSCWFRRFVRRLLFRTLGDVVLMLDQESAYRAESSTTKLSTPLPQSNLTTIVSLSVV